jgi:hypothetical protein
MMKLQLNSRCDELARAHETLWAAVCFDPSTSLHCPAAPEAVVAFEAAAGVNLSSSHREFLRRADGGQAGGVLYFAVASERGEHLAWHAAHTRPNFERTAGRPVFPFAKNWGGDHYCYDLSRPRAEGDYPVLCWDHAADDRGDDPLAIWSEVAPGFLEFVAWGLAKPVTPPAFVLTNGGAELWIGGNRRAVIEWPQIRQIAVEVVMEEDYLYYSEAFWQLTGPGTVFRAPVGLATGAERFEARLLEFPGFDAVAYRGGQESAACREPGVFVCWSREADGAEQAASADRPRD